MSAQSEMKLERAAIRARASKPMLWIGLVSITMIFAALTSAYIVRQADPDWLSLQLPQPFFVSTAIIVLSSMTLWAAAYFIKQNNYAQVTNFVGLTLLLAVGFVFAQFYTYSYMVDEGYYLTGSNISSSFLYILTGLHLAHLFGGIIALIVTMVYALRKKYSKDHKLGFELTATYWHYLTGLWIYLLLFLLFVK
ncbi:MAG TPA: cytochrome oxidase subunit III [Flavobacteriales bacterium]|jgi:cytochrome c oxidase subunit 3|nr:cytochrome oxidase subunit III [Flavobacteriales bacterium]